MKEARSGPAAPGVRTLLAPLCALLLQALPAHAQPCGIGTGGTAECDAPADATAAAHPARPSTLIGNPVDLASGNKYQQATDFASHRSPLQFRRHYASRNADVNLGLGNGWRGSYDTRLYRDVDGTLVLQESGGHRTRFHPTESASGAAATGAGTGPWAARTPSDGRIVRNGEVYVRAFPDGRSVRYRGRWPVRVDHPDGQFLRIAWREGRVSSVTDGSGESLRFEYTPGNAGLSWYEAHPDGTQPGLLERLVLPDGRAIRYRYDARRNLSNVEFPDGSVRTYHYEREDLPSHLTGITEPDGTRDVTWRYDDAGTTTAIVDAASGIETRLVVSAGVDGGGTGSTAVADSTGAYALYRWHHDRIDDRFTLLGGEGVACASCPPTGVEYRYRDDLQLEAERSADGREIRYGYDGSGRLSSVTGPSGDRTELVHDAPTGRPTTVRRVRRDGSSIVHPILYPSASAAARAGATGPVIGLRHRLSATTHRARDRGCVAACVAGGAAIGGTIGRGVGTTVGGVGGAVLGGAAGTVVLPGGGTIGGGGIGGAVGGAAGGTVGGAGGAAIGGTLGGLLSSIVCAQETTDGEAEPDAETEGVVAAPTHDGGEDPECRRIRSDLRNALYRDKRFGARGGTQGFFRRAIEQMCGAHGPADGGGNVWHAHVAALEENRNQIRNLRDRARRKRCDLSRELSRTDRSALQSVLSPGWSPARIVHRGPNHPDCAVAEALLESRNLDALRRLVMGL